MPDHTHKFYYDPKYRKLKLKQLKAWYASLTPAQLELRNAKQAVRYRETNAARLFDLKTYAGSRDAKKWVQVAKDRLKKAEAGLHP